MSKAPRILIVDDDPRIRDMLDQYLRREGLDVCCAADGGAMRRYMDEAPVDLVILDLVMPGEDGLALAREIRVRSAVPIIIVTGKDDPIDRVIGLEVGADDYVAKPFHLRELLARVRAVLRRTAVPEAPTSADVPPSARSKEQARFGGWHLDLVKRELYDPNDTLVALTASEFGLLCAFLRSPNRVLNRDQLMDATRGHDWTPFDRSIDTQVGRLRKKLEANPGDPRLIKTVRGMGYIFAAHVAWE